MKEKQIKYLVSHFSRAKQKALYNKTRIVLNNLYGYSKHFKQRIATKRIALPSYLLDSLAAGKFDIIELNYTYYKNYYTSRAVVRSLESYNNKQLCLVVDLDNHVLVTAWTNKVGDIHSSIKLSKYINF